MDADELTPETVDFVLDVSTLASIPPIAGSRVMDVWSGNASLRPFVVPLVDKDGKLIELFNQRGFTEASPTEEVSRGRWAVLGRMVDLQFQRLPADPETDPWETISTGRCSDLDEMEGPGLFRVQIADESWKARKAVRVFEFADTTRLWPAGVAAGARIPESTGFVSSWRGFSKPNPAFGDILQTNGNLHQIELRAVTEYQNPSQFPWLRQGMITDRLLSWVRSQRKQEVSFDPSTYPEGNFKHLRLRYGRSALGGPTAPDRDFEVVSFGGLDEESMFDSLQNRQTSLGGSVVWSFIRLWVRSAAHPTTGDPEVPVDLGGALGSNGFLWAPTAPPSDSLPLHIGVNSPIDAFNTSIHPWGSEGGYLSMADLTRRVWTKLGLRFNPENLDELEADLSIPPVADRIGTREADNPEQYMQERVWGPRGFSALRDRQGRRKLVDMRAPLEVNLKGLPHVRASNIRNHRWQLLGREAVNLITVVTSDMEHVPHLLSYVGSVSNATVQEADSTPGLDYIRIVPSETPFEGDTIEAIGERARRYEVQNVLEPSASDARKADHAAQNRGALWEEVAEQLMAGLLQMHQDGLVRGSFELGKGLADEIEEGQLLVLDHDSVKGANPTTVARSGVQVVRVISLTRSPASSEVEYVLIPVQTFVACPDPEE